MSIGISSKLGEENSPGFVPLESQMHATTTTEDAVSPAKKEKKKRKHNETETAHSAVNETKKDKKKKRKIESNIDETSLMNNEGNEQALAVTARDVDGTPEDVSEKKKKKKKEKRAEKAVEESSHDAPTDVVETKKKREKKQRKVEAEAVDALSKDEKEEEEEKKARKKKKKSKEVDNVELEVQHLETGRTEKKKKRKDNSTANELPDPAQDSTLTEQASKALIYAYSQFANPSDWKFNKARQNWLIRNFLSNQNIPDSQFPLAKQYLSNVQGGVREALIKTCNSALNSTTSDSQTTEQPTIEPSQQSENVEPPPGSDEGKLARAKAMLQELSKSS